MSEITPQIVADHGLNEEEYARILHAMGRVPNMVELGIFSVMWSEHCSYKSSRIHLKKLPTQAPWVICGPGENAGVIDIGEGPNGSKLAAIFKMESHNHPSYIEPYQGAATGVGGILRDVFTMGARPVANMNALRFGRPDHPKMKHLVQGVVAGIGGYGNCVGVPTVGGETNFHPAYDGNILVNAMTVGVADQDKIFYSAATGLGNPIVYVGSKTGRDGIHGATMASADFGADIEEKRPTVQVGDPFTEKLLLEASLELIRSGHIVAIQDMGAAGLTSSSAEMAERGDVGVTIDVTKVPVREQGMTPYEILLSESQERMLVVAKLGHEDDVRAILAKWDLEAAVIGEVIAEPVYRVTEGARVVAEFPGSRLVTECPQYVLEPRESDALKAARGRSAHAVAPLDEERDHAWTLERLLSSPTIASKKWVWQQYDSTVRTSTMRGPGSDAAVVKLRGTDKAIALCIDGNGRHVALSPRNGGRAAVSEAARNVACTGARPMAITNNLNFGNPTKPEVYFQLSEAIAGMGEACTVLETPVTGGNVSLYNENPQGAIHPTPTIGMVGLIESLSHVTPSGFQTAGDDIVLFGDCTDELGASEYLLAIHGLTIGEPPVCEPKRERVLIDALLESIRSGLVRSAHDCSDGGLAVALSECAMSDRDRVFGFNVDLSAWATLPHRALLFGEAHGRVVVSTANSVAVLQIAQRHGVPARVIGTVTNADGGAHFRMSDDTFSAPMGWLAKAFHEAIPLAMDGEKPAEHAVTSSHAPTND